MSMMFLAAMMMAQAPAAVPPQPASEAKPKPKQVCEYIEITGSRSKRRVCRDENGQLDLGPGVSDSAYGKTRINEPGSAVNSGGPGGQ
jgi:hypothetical protein